MADLSEQVSETCVTRAKIIKALAGAAQGFAERGDFAKAREMFESLARADDAREAVAVIQKGAPLNIDEKIEVWTVKQFVDAVLPCS